MLVILSEAKNLKFGLRFFVALPAPQNDKKELGHG